MADFQALTAAILTQAGTVWPDGPVIWPNEKFDPERPGGRFGEFSAGCDHVLIDVQFYQSPRESHGTNGLRSRTGEMLAFAHTKGNEGPGRALEVADAFAAGFRDARLLSDELQFGEPLVELIGEGDDQFYVALARCPFTAWSASP